MWMNDGWLPAGELRRENILSLQKDRTSETREHCPEPSSLMDAISTSIKVSLSLILLSICEYYEREMYLVTQWATSLFLATHMCRQERIKLSPLFHIHKSHTCGHSIVYFIQSVFVVSEIIVGVMFYCQQYSRERLRAVLFA